MKILKTTSPQDQALQQIEDKLRELDMQIECGGNSLIVTIKGQSYALVDWEDTDRGIDLLPRTFDGERLAILDDEY